MCAQSVNNLRNIDHPSPYLIKEGVYGATFYKSGEPLYLRMELLTKKTSNCWKRYATMSSWIANSRNGVLSCLVEWADTPQWPKYEKIKNLTGFSKEEFDAYQETIKLKKTNKKIGTVLNANSAGIDQMSTSADGSSYVVYITKNHDFSIEEADKTAEKERSLKNFVESYKDILISVGSDFSNFTKEGNFHNRGIARNPYWVFEEKYSGFSMLLHGFSAVVADEFFSVEKTNDLQTPGLETKMIVVPIGSMQVPIKKSLLPGEGYAENGDRKIDITELPVSSTDPEGKRNHIKNSALKRVYYKTIEEFKMQGVT